MKKTNLVIVALILTSVTLSCTLFKGGTGRSPFGSQDVGKLPFPSIDKNTPFPAMSANVIDALANDIPGLAMHRDKLLDAERAAINEMLAGARPETRPKIVRVDDHYPATGGDDNNYQSTYRFIRSIEVIPAAYAADSAPSMLDMGGLEYYVVGYQAGFFTPDYGKPGDQDRGQSVTKEIKNELTGTVVATQTISVGSDGNVSVEFSTSINLPIQGLNANSKVKVTGNQCPTADGKIDLTVEFATNGRAGSSGSMTYDKTLSGKISASVNDNAELASFHFDLIQSTRSTAGGREAYVESSEAVRSDTGSYSEMNWGDRIIVQTPSQTTEGDQKLMTKGIVDAFSMAKGILDNAQRWQEGGCVKIEAESPGSVDVNSTHQIPVKVTSKVDGAEVPSKLEATLAGDTSVDPTVIPKTAGTLTYVAPGEAGKTATISLTATSRRGKATLDLTASTSSNSYHIKGGLDDFQTSTAVCDIMKPFTLTGGGFTNKFSGGMSGTYNFTGPFKSQGSGTYTISLPDGPGKPGTMTGEGSGSVLGTFTGTGTEKYTLTPIEPCG